MISFSKACAVVRWLGPGFALQRTSLAIQRRLGMTRRKFSPRPWDSLRLEDIARPGTPTTPEDYARFKTSNPPPFLFPLGAPPRFPPFAARSRFERVPSLEDRLRLLERGQCIYFFDQIAQRTLDWYDSPFDNARAEDRSTWCDIPDFSPRHGDPRILWEPSRAAWAFDLARAGAHGIPFDAAVCYWRWVDSWMNACPPFQGFQWKCGQESSVRFIAIAIAFWSLAADPATTPQRWLQFARLAWATGYRVSRHIRYAVSQHNNHALSEACGLLLIGSLFPEFRESANWERLGRKIFTAELTRQVNSDGSYIQHSFTYHRVMLHVAMLAWRVTECSGRPLDDAVRERIGLAGEFLFHMMDRVTGRVPNYGNCDGALVLPLTECDFSDFRPVVQSAHVLATGRHRFPPGPWDEELVWLFGEAALRHDVDDRLVARSRAFSGGGYYTIRRRDSWAMIRCHEYRTRPGHCDSLHVDLWYKGINILCDCGTFRYYVPSDPALEAYFRSTRAHNTIEVNDNDGGEWITRFLFLPFPKAECSTFDPQTKSMAEPVFEGRRTMHHKRTGRIEHRRCVVALAEDLWIVVDTTRAPGAHSVVMRWHCADVPCEVSQPGQSVTLTLPDGLVSLSVAGYPRAPAEFAVNRGRDGDGRICGYAARYYNRCVAIPTLEARFACGAAQRMFTAIGLGGSTSIRRAEETEETDRWHITCGNSMWIVELSPLGRKSPRTYLRSRRAAALLENENEVPATGTTARS